MRSQARSFLTPIPKPSNLFRTYKDLIVASQPKTFRSHKPFRTRICEIPQQVISTTCSSRTSSSSLPSALIRAHKSICRSSRHSDATKVRIYSCNRRVIIMKLILSQTTLSLHRHSSFKDTATKGKREVGRYHNSLKTPQISTQTNIWRSLTAHNWTGRKLIWRILTKQAAAAFGLNISQWTACQLAWWTLTTTLSRTTTRLSGKSPKWRSRVTKAGTPSVSWDLRTRAKVQI